MRAICRYGKSIQLTKDKIYIVGKIYPNHCVWIGYPEEISCVGCNESTVEVVNNNLTTARYAQCRFIFLED